MKYLNLLIFYFLLSTNSFADIGDVYYCSSTQVSSSNGLEIEQFKTMVFKFKLDEGKVTFTNDDYFENSKPKAVDTKFAGQEIFTGGVSGYEIISFRNGRLVFISNQNYDEDIKAELDITTIVAQCDKFS